MSGCTRGVASSIKTIPGIGTVIGIITSTIVSASATGLMGYFYMKIFEKELRDDGILKFIKELAKCYNNAVDGMLELRTYFDNYNRNI